MSSFLLEFTSEIGLNDSTVDNFPDTIMNGIFIYDSGMLTDPQTTLWYGDEMTMGKWYTLQIPFGTVNSSMTVYTLIAGYSYVLDYTVKTFVITDSLGSVIVTRTGIASIADLGIDFTVYHSHQFIIKLSYNELLSSFIFPAIIVGLSMTLTIYNNGGGISDDFIPMTPSGSTYNPEAGNYGRIGACEQYFYSNNFQIAFTLLLLEITTGINKYSANLSITAKYPFFYDISLANITLNRRELIGNILDYNSFILPMFTISLFPNLMPVEYVHEFINNRPTYEPWMILGIYKLIYTTITEDSGDTYVLETFDLSPNFGG